MARHLAISACDVGALATQPRLFRVQDSSCKRLAPWYCGCEPRGSCSDRRHVGSGSQEFGFPRRTTSYEVRRALALIATGRGAARVGPAWLQVLAFAILRIARRGRHRRCSASTRRTICCMTAKWADFLASWLRAAKKDRLQSSFTTLASRK